MKRAIRITIPMVGMAFIAACVQQVPALDGGPYCAHSRQPTAPTTLPPQ
jgi:hypothetical protein